MTKKRKGGIIGIVEKPITPPERTVEMPLYVDYSTGEIVSQEEITLADGKRKWQERKKMSIKVANLMKQYDPERAAKIMQCGTYLEFVKKDNGLNLQRANFCRERLCPMCQWRRSIKLAVQSDKIYRILTEQGYKHVFVTLTVRNCKAEELGDTLDRLTHAWKKYRVNKQYKNAVRGAYSAIEITYNKAENTYHPHIHALFTVDNDYYTSPDYIKHEDLMMAWRKVMKIDYDPQVQIEAVRQKENQTITSACVELCKYPAKTAEINSSEVLETIDYALRGRRIINWYGIVAEIRKKLDLDDIEQGNLINTDDAAATAEAAGGMEKVVYVWRYGVYTPMTAERLEDAIKNAKEIQKKA